MRHAVFASAVVVAALVCCTSALGLGADHRPGQPVHWSPEWPEGLRELLEPSDFVHGYFVNASDFFFYAGDTEALNQFLQQYAALEDTPLTLVLHPGQGMVASPWAKDDRKPFDWELKVLRRDHPEAAEATDEDDSAYVVTVHLWLGGEVELEGVEVPLDVKVKSGGEIEEFIAAHEAKQKAKAPEQ